MSDYINVIIGVSARAFVLQSYFKDFFKIIVDE